VIVVVIHPPGPGHSRNVAFKMICHTYQREFTAVVGACGIRHRPNVAMRAQREIARFSSKRQNRCCVRKFSAEFLRLMSAYQQFRVSLWARLPTIVGLTVGFRDQLSQNFAKSGL
jgi:hypothetical protein